VGHGGCGGFDLIGPRVIVLRAEKSSADNGSRRFSLAVTFGSRIGGAVVPSYSRIGNARSTVSGPKPSHLS
jgi:hypothetical protein